ncbi:MBL fold metallo-hydrolase [Steroidobacter agaridevorans]|uniref:MBL fold metallo-hydrolase n=1 Tax=Steroidobacter agaridevorans TaxID=2695856 RepID=A0A829YGP0_9GAMM|nr:MBL fold metallo-hydrolase [Steroidobacter agaridevorans]GFE81756.1 MBL fold metallo-hydrolase [Steroidobacter agaridevorans]GFE90500.1 MBL fold metallo-hydrolase [Steroidobacter agaridevorans]
MKALIVPVTPFQQNCSIIWDERSKRAAVVDPGGDLDRVLAEVDREGLQLEKILLTHGHLDHAAATAELAKLRGLTIEGPHRDDQFWIDQLPEATQRFGFPQAEAFTPDRWLEQGDQVTVGEETLEVRHCPGHTPGHVIFFHARQKFAWVGDVIFAGSIGRSDFPRGDHDTLVRSIRENLFPLGDDVRFVPGHGPLSTFGQERQTNPFVADRRFR